VSGIGGVTYEWLMPEIRQISDPLALPFEVRKQNDFWAYEQLRLKLNFAGGAEYDNLNSQSGL
jgi:hypothetical protein